MKELLAIDPAERWYQLGRFIAFHNIEPDKLWQVFPHDRWPLPFLEAGGRLNFVEWQEICAYPIYQPPRVLTSELTKMRRCQWITQEKYEGPLLQWAGDRGLVLDFGPGESAALNNAEKLSQIPVNKFHCFAAIRFLSPPCESNPPLLQKIWLPMDGLRVLPEPGAVLEKTSRDPTLLNPLERKVLHQRLAWLTSFDCPEVIEFPPPFNRFFAYGFLLLNLKHPITQCLLQFLATFELLKNRRILPEDKVENLEVFLKSLWGDWEFLDFINDLSRMWLLAHNLQLFCVDEVENLIPRQEEFVPGTFGEPLRLENLLEAGNIRPFGQPLADVFTP